MIISYHYLRYLVITVLLLFSTIVLTGCTDLTDLEAIATTPDGRILLLKEIEQEDDSPREQHLYFCSDLKGKIPQLSCSSNLKL
ncbi:hypothetical protein [Alkalinema sp. FACHB-956]|uniref:hypothetical protein n=1 Tax=Alkalinema sp. FACHB-956 TaxID=2692768 RepID=UPI001687C389|nr:hypothetical protein [Alkalinema sp. FACHB-956]MBD2328884.1 hypothetical protein [Alkalinema sp. FACHB-956]